MGWLRKNRDAIALVLAWALLIQSALLAFASATHAAALASGEAAIICTSNGTVAAKEAPQPKRHGPHCDCCSLACRAGCNSVTAGLAPEAAILLPLPDLAGAEALLTETPKLDSADIFAAKPRGPPSA
jgi:hypothetical protein